MDPPRVVLDLKKEEQRQVLEGRFSGAGGIKGGIEILPLAHGFDEVLLWVEAFKMIYFNDVLIGADQVSRTGASVL